MEVGLPLALYVACLLFILSLGHVLKSDTEEPGAREGLARWLPESLVARRALEAVVIVSVLSVGFFFAYNDVTFVKMIILWLVGVPVVVTLWVVFGAAFDARMEPDDGTDTSIIAKTYRRLRGARRPTDGDD